jgi:hypothetical protein
MNKYDWLSEGSDCRNKFGALESVFFKYYSVHLCFAETTIDQTMFLSKLTPNLYRGKNSQKLGGCLPLQISKQVS